MTMQLTMAFWVFFLVCPQLASSQILKTVSQDNSLVKYASAADEMPGICREIAAAVMAYDASLSFQGLDQPVPLTRIEKMLESGIIDVFFVFYAIGIVKRVSVTLMFRFTPCDMCYWQKRTIPSTSRIFPTCIGLKNRT